MGMQTREPFLPTQQGPVRHQSLPVVGLDLGREVARRHSRARRRRDLAFGFVMFLLVAVVVGGAGYLTWEYFQTEQDTDGVVPGGRSSREVIAELEEQPIWNGPGTPDLGVGNRP